jgi:hypothetical protein
MFAISSPLPNVSSSRVVRVTANIVRNARGTAGMRELWLLQRQIEAVSGDSELLASVGLVLAAWKVANRGAPDVGLILALIDACEGTKECPSPEPSHVYAAIRRLARFGLRLFVEGDSQAAERNIGLGLLRKRRAIADFVFASGKPDAIKAWCACVQLLDTLPKVGPSHEAEPARLAIRDHVLTVGAAFHAYRLVNGPHFDENVLALWMKQHVPRGRGSKALAASTILEYVEELGRYDMVG